MSVEAMKQALEALVGYELVYGSDEKDREAVRALRQAIEQAEKQDVEQSSTESKETFDQPVAWMSSHDVGFKRSEFGDTPTVPLYTTPPQRKPLTGEQIGDLLLPFPAYESEWDAEDFYRFVKAIEAAHGIKGDA